MSASGTTELGNHVAGSAALQCQLDGGAQDDCAKDSSGATGCEMRSMDDRARAPGTSCRAERDSASPRGATFSIDRSQ